MPLKICVFGAGAIGGLLAARLSQTNAEISCVARGPMRDAISKHGLRLVSGEREIITPVAVSDDPRDLGPQDFVLLTVKAQSVPEIVTSLPFLMTDATTLVTLQNGLPWWFLQSLPGPYEGHGMQSVDPDGRVAAAIDHDRILGGVVYPAASVMAPGSVRHVSGRRFALGEPGGALTPRLTALAEVMQDAGFEAASVDNIRSEICAKWIANAALNPVSVLTGASMSDMIDNPEVCGVLSNMMHEVEDVCGALGCSSPIPVDALLSGARKMGRHKSSMLQDFETGRPLETAALLDTVQDVSTLVNIPTPTFDTIYSLLRLKLRQI